MYIKKKYFPTSGHPGTDQTDTLPTDTLEMDKLASSFALEDSPGEPEGEGDERLDLLHKKTLRLGETDTDDDDDDLPETRGSLETKKTLDYTEVSKKVGYFNLNPSIFFFAIINASPGIQQVQQKQNTFLNTCWSPSIPHAPVR